MLIRMPGVLTTHSRGITVVNLMAEIKGLGHVISRAGGLFGTVVMLSQCSTVGLHGVFCQTVQASVFIKIKHFQAHLTKIKHFQGLENSVMKIKHFQGFQGRVRTL